MESYIQNTRPKKYLFEGLRGGPVDLENIIGAVFTPALRTSRSVGTVGILSGEDWPPICISLGWQTS